MPETRNDLIEFTKTQTGGISGGDLVWKYRILTRPGQLPYTVMNKKEYYEKWEVKLGRIIDENMVSRVKFEEAAKISGDKRDLEMKDRQIAQLKSTMNKIDLLLKSKTAAELSGPAYRGEENGEYYETSTKEHPCQYIIKPNLAYYNPGLFKNSAQLVTLCFRYGTGKDSNGNPRFSDEAFYNELVRIRIMDLLTAELKSTIAR